MIPAWLQNGIEVYGYWVILGAVALESMGIPFPGETALLAGAIYAGTTDRMSIVLVIIAAAAGAIIGDNIGFSIGRYGGYPVLRRILRIFHIDESRLAYAQRYFERHGNKTVFFGRFFSLLRTWVAFLAGVNRMPWRSFLFWNACGGIVWATFYGTLGYVLGNNLALLGTVLKVLGTGGAIALGAFIVGAIVFWVVRRRQRERELLKNERRLDAEESDDGTHTEPMDEPDTTPRP
jgi:membrane protein DedA with SNARE-associated domain